MQALESVLAVRQEAHTLILVKGSRISAQCVACEHKQFIQVVKVQINLRVRTSTPTTYFSLQGGSPNCILYAAQWFANYQRLKTTDINNLTLSCDEETMKNGWEQLIGFKTNLTIKTKNLFSVFVFSP